MHGSVGRAGMHRHRFSSGALYSIVSGRCRAKAGGSEEVPVKVTEFLKTVGAKVGLIRIVEEVRVIEFSSLQTRSVSLNDLMQEFEGTREENVAGSAIELSID